MQILDVALNELVQLALTEYVVVAVQSDGRTPATLPRFARKRLGILRRGDARRVAVGDPLLMAR